MISYLNKSLVIWIQIPLFNREYIQFPTNLLYYMVSESYGSNFLGFYNWETKFTLDHHSRVICLPHRWPRKVTCWVSDHSSESGDWTNIEWSSHKKDTNVIALLRGSILSMDVTFREFEPCFPPPPSPLQGDNEKQEEMILHSILLDNHGEENS